MDQHRLKDNLARQSSAELQRIASSEDETEWTREAVEVARELLDERARGISIEPAEPDSTLPAPDPLKLAGQVAIDASGCIGSVIVATVVASVVWTAAYLITDRESLSWSWSVVAFIATFVVGHLLVRLFRRAIGLETVSR